MTVTINSNSDSSEIRKRIGRNVGRTHLRTSESRRNRLRQSARRRTRVWDLGLEIDPDHPTAHCDQNKGTPEEVITGRELPQPVTDMDGQDWDWTAQKALGAHEDGHVLFTDHDDFKDRLRNVDSGNTGTAKQIWNALEDGAIELGLQDRWPNFAELLRILRANMFADGEPGIQDVERGGRVFPLAHATHSVLMDEWMDTVYDIDRAIKPKLVDPDDDEYHFATDDDREIFVDEILPLIEGVVPDVLSQPDAVERNARIFEFIEEVMEHISDGRADGRSQMNRDEDETPDGMPDDASNGHSGEAQQDLDELDDIDPDDIDKVTVDPSADPDTTIDVEVPDDVEVEIAEQVAEQSQAEAGAGQDLMEEIDEIIKALDTGPNELASSEIEMPTEDWTHNQSVIDKAAARSESTAQILRNRLQQERESSVQRGLRRGRFTGRGGAINRAQRGVRGVKEQQSEPDEKDYWFAFVLDRSGSMRSCITEAELQMIQLAFALETVGVKVMIVEMLNTRARLAKPFGSSVRSQKRRLAHGKCGGSTPLAPAVDLVRQRLLQADGHTALVVVTDGLPDSSEAFEDVIESCSMPTLGVNLTDEQEPAGMDQYDRATAANPSEDLGQVLDNLVQEVMF